VWKPSGRFAGQFHVAEYAIWHRRFVSCALA
jgi:hypothetical protein